MCEIVMNLYFSLGKEAGVLLKALYHLSMALKAEIHQDRKNSRETRVLDKGHH